MTSALRPGALVAGLVLLAAPVAAGCLAVVRLADEVELVRAETTEFALSWRHSVTLTPVVARYAIDDSGLRQIDERFAAHGPGLAHEAKGWRREGEEFVVPLDRPVPRLILRAAPEHENRLRLPGALIDLTIWPGTPLEILPLPCEDATR
ncbi:MAG: DUF1850 domain-containing protein [Gemmobacter sp.]